MVLGKRVTMHTCIVEGAIKKVWGFEATLFVKVNKSRKQNTGIPRFTLLMWGHKRKTAEAKTA